MATTVRLPLSSEMLETTTITREALQGLANRAGMTMAWNDGEPVFYDELGLGAGHKVEVAKAKAAGASDADIAAGEKLLRSAPADMESMISAYPSMTYRGVRLDARGMRELPQADVKVILATLKNELFVAES